MNRIDTRQYLTHVNLNSNLFSPEKNQIAFPAILPCINFRQWHLTDKILQLTGNVNVAKYASLIGVFPVMGKYAYQVPHAVMGEKFGSIFGCKPPAPQTVAKWENILVELKLLEKPNHMLWGGMNKSKLRVFTDKFWNMAREHCREKLSYICPPSTLWRSCSTIIRKEQTIPEDPINNNLETPKRARVDIKERVETTHTTHADRVENIKQGQEKRKPVHILDGNHTTALKKYGSQKKSLPKIFSQVLHCIMTKSEVKDQMAGVLFFADVVRAYRRGDEYTRRFFGNWPDLTQDSKGWHINQLLAHMRRTGGEIKLCEAPISIESAAIENSPDTELEMETELNRMVSALCMGNGYTGPLRADFEKLAALSSEKQILAIDELLGETG